MKDISEKTRKLIGNFVLLFEEEKSWLILSKSDCNGGQAIHLSKSAHHEIFKVLTGGDISAEDTERVINLDCFKRLVSSDEDSDADAVQKLKDNSESGYVIQNTELIHEEIEESKLDEYKECSQTAETKEIEWNTEVDYDSGITDSDCSDKSEEFPEHTIDDLFHMLTTMNNVINLNGGMNYSLVLFNVYRTCHLLNARISQMPNLFTQSAKYAPFAIAFFNELAAVFEYLDENFPSVIFAKNVLVSDIYYLTGLKKDIESVLSKSNTTLQKKGSVKMMEELLSRTDLMKQKYFNRFPFSPTDYPFSAKCAIMYEVKKLHEGHWNLVSRGVYCQQPRVLLQPKFAMQIKLIQSKLNISEVDRCPECNVLLSKTEFAVLRECNHVICLRCAELHSTKLASDSVSTWHFYCPICEAKVKAWSSSLHMPATRPNLLSKVKPLAALFGSQVLIMAVLYGLVKKGVLAK